MADEEVYYSAKHWAKKSEKFANETRDTKESAETAIALVEGFDTTVEQAKTAITSLATEEKNNIRTVGDEEEAAVTNAGTTGVANVKAAETTGVANVNKATSDGVAQIQAEATGFVKTSGNQTVGGIKTFTNGTASIKVSRGDATYGEIMFTKKDGTRTGGVRNIQEPTGNTTLIYVTSDDGTSIKGNIQVALDGTTVKTSAPTPPASDNSTQIATTAWVNTRLGGTGVTSTELGYLDGVTSAIQTQLNAKAPLASPALTGNPTAPTQGVGNNSTRVATTAFVNNFQPAVTALSATSGTVSLAVNKIYTISVSRTTTFSLPTPSNTNIFNQIKLMMKVTGTPTINWGTTRFFNKSTPSIEAGNYDVYFDYDKLMSVWVCGVMAKGTAS